MVLDSAYEPTGDSEYDQWITRPVGFDQAFANWAAWCEEGTECAFTDVDVAARWDALLAALGAKPVKSDTGRPVNHVVMETATKSAMYSELAWPSLGAALADAEVGDGTALLAMADSFNGRSSDGTYDSIYQANPVIRCASGIDQVTPADPAALLAELQKAAPRFGRSYDLTDFRRHVPRLNRRGHRGDRLVISGAGADRRRRRSQRPGDAIPLGRRDRRPDGPQRRPRALHGRGHGQILGSSCVTDAEALVIRDLQLPAPDTTCEPDPPVARPAFWDDLPVPPDVGPLVDDPAIDLAIGLPPSQVYADVWHLSGDPATVAEDYEAGFTELGFEVIEAPDLLPGAIALAAFAPDETQVVILVIPPDVVTSDPDFEAAAELANPGQGFVVVAALGDV